MTLEQTDLGAALERIAELTDALDRALCREDDERHNKHHAANQAQRLVGVAESAVRELVAAGANDAAARIQEMIRVALEK